jgi:hypothetical protein
MTLRMYGLTNPAATQAPACIPGVPEKKSTVSPVKKEIMIKIQEASSTGRRRRIMT